MPPPRLRPKPSSHGASSLFRYIFPHTRQRARAHLAKLRHESLPALRRHTQSRIYKYILYRQALKLQKRPGILQRLRAHTTGLIGDNNLENEARRRRHKLTTSANPHTSSRSERSDMSYQDGYGPREPGARRKKLAGYIKAANELRQTYQQQYAPAWTRSETSYDYEDATPSEFADGAVVRSGEEEMILFPSYARKHIKRKPESAPGTIQETPGDGRDVRDSAGAGDAEFWKQQWDEYEDDNAIVDVDVRGWIYSPHKGQMSRKQRLFIGLARQLVGIQAPPATSKPSSASPSPLGSRDPSPGQQARQTERDEALAAQEAEEILRRGEKKAATAAKGAYSEKPPADDTDNRTLYRTQSRDSVRTLDSEYMTPVRKRASWNQPADMSQAELAEANARLMARLRHFLAIPMANTPISVFFYNEEISRQRTVYTNPSGHFSISAALDFIPTHVRILASDKLSATEEIIVTESHGVSVISDIDDTIKHSAISSGAREIFRNAFIRDLGDLTIEGVKEWYSKMAEMGVSFHYVSNSPWQLFPVISKYFAMAGLPPGSFHLKQYSGMLQGIFEPVAERKKGTLDKIARDFPDRRFVLVGDSGEADLEVYTEFVLENPGRVIAVFIRDVTTTEGGGFFDPSVGPFSGALSSSSGQRGNSNASNKFTTVTGTVEEEEEDPELNAAVEASLRDMEEEGKGRSKSMFPTMDPDHPELRPQLPPRRTTQLQTTQPVANLIDLSSDEEQGQANLPKPRRTNSDTGLETQQRTSIASTRSAPPPPRKPIALRSSSGDSLSQSSPRSPTTHPKGPPPKPRRPSSTVHQSSPLASRASTQDSASSTKAQLGQESAPSSPPTYTGAALEHLASAYNNLPSIHSGKPSDESPTSTTAETSHKKAPPPPPPPRRGKMAYPVAAASYVGGKAVSAWQNAPSVPHPSIRSTHANPYSTNASGPQPGRTNTSSTLGTGGGNGNGNGYDPAYGQAGMNKREILWRQRWERAEQVLGEKGVKLKSWKVGTDVMDEAEKLIKEAIGREKEEKSRDDDSANRGKG